MKKYELLVQDENVPEFDAVLETLSFIKNVTQTNVTPSDYTLASEEALAQDWLSEEDDKLQKLYKI